MYAGNLTGERTGKCRVGRIFPGSPIYALSKKRWVQNRTHPTGGRTIFLGFIRVFRHFVPFVLVYVEWVGVVNMFQRISPS